MFLRSATISAKVYKTDWHKGHPGVITGSQGDGLTISWSNILSFLFRPEDSSRLSVKNIHPSMVTRTKSEILLIQLKALVWIVVSIIIGLLVGRLS